MKFRTLKKTFWIILILFSVRSCVRDDNQWVVGFVKEWIRATKTGHNTKVFMHSTTFEHIFPVRIIRKWPTRFHHERTRGSLCCHYYHYFYYYYDIFARGITSARRFCWSPPPRSGRVLSLTVFSLSFYDAMRTRRSFLVIEEGTKRSRGEGWRENSIYFYFISENISPLRAFYSGVFPPRPAEFRETVRFTTFVATTRYLRNRLNSTA